jgi:hypothetical protein
MARPSWVGKYFPGTSIGVNKNNKVYDNGHYYKVSSSIRRIRCQKLLECEDYIEQVCDGV